MMITTFLRVSYSSPTQTKIPVQTACKREAYEQGFFKSFHHCLAAAVTYFFFAVVFLAAGFLAAVAFLAGAFFLAAGIVTS